MSYRWKRTYQRDILGMRFREAFMSDITQLEPDGVAERAGSRADAALEAHVQLLEILTSKGLLTADDLQQILGPSFKRISE